MLMIDISDISRANKENNIENDVWNRFEQIIAVN